MKFAFRSTALIATLTLSACSTQLQQEPPATATTPEETSPAPEQKQEIEPRPFPAETLYSLITAELAGSRERFDIALGNYMQQAYKTRDAGVAERATHIARYLNAQTAIINASTLWTELAPDNLEAHYIAGTSLAKSGRLLEASRHSEVLVQNKGVGIYQTIAVQAARTTDIQREQLLERYQELLQQTPDNTELMTATGLLHHQAGNIDTALDYARQALAIDPKLIPAATLEARLLLAEKKTHKALQRLKQLLNEYPNDQRLRLQYARLLAGIDLKAAQEQFQTLLQQSPNDSELLFSMALLTRELGELEAATNHFNKLLSYPKRRSSALYYLGRIAETREDYELALQNYLRVEPGPDFIAALLHSADILVRTDKKEKAHARLNDLRNKFPDQAERLFLLEAEVLSNHSELNAAEVVLSDGLERFPTSTKLLYSRAMLHEQMDMIDKLEVDLRTLLKYDPNNATALNALGYTLVDRTDRLEEAKVLITKALQIRPDDAAIIDSLGWLLYREGDLEGALVRLQQAMKLMPDHEIAAHLGEVLWKTGAHQEARAIWQQGLELKKNSSIILETIQRLDP